MRTEIRPALMMLLLLTLITGVAYPLVVTGIARLVFPAQAEGSLLRVNGRIVGSRLIGQSFDQPQYFWGRLSATGPVPYNAAASSGSNYGPLNPALLDAVRARIAALRSADPTATGPVPVDLVTASGSGLDPDISPAAAEYQVARVAKARGVGPDRVRAVIRAHTAGRTWGIVGEPVVHVLELDLDLDARFGTGSARPGDGRR
jgi:K+-transporting ATPase ATPase C chain